MYIFFGTGKVTSIVSPYYTAWKMPSKNENEMPLLADKKKKGGRDTWGYFLLLIQCFFLIII